MDKKKKNFFGLKKKIKKEGNYGIQKIKEGII